jgi:hypothetical protein
VLAPDDVDGLAAKLDWLAGHREGACRMGTEAAEGAQTVSWKAHAERLQGLIGEIWN